MPVTRSPKHPLNSRLRAFARTDDGAALVEFALVLPMMLLVLSLIHI